MTEVFAAFARAVRSQLAPPMLLLLLAPFVFALLAWVLSAWLIWDPMMNWINESVKTSGGFLRPVWDFLARHKLQGVLPFLLLVLFEFPLVFFTALALIAAFATPVVTRFLGANDYRDLQRYGSSFDARALGASLWNSAKSFAIFLVGYLATMPLWLIPGLILIVPWFWWSWLTARMLRMDSLMDHASSEERKQLINMRKPHYFALAGLVSLLNYVPPLFIVAPIFAALAFGHYSLNALRELRKSTPPPLPSSGKGAPLSLQRSA